MEKLKGVYEQLLKLKLLNFRMAELYIDFVKAFVGLDFLDKDDSERLTNLQKIVVFEDIAENPFPTITIYPESGLLEDANGEAQKFFAMTRFELKGKKIESLILPSMDKEFIDEATKDGRFKNGDSFCAFFKKAEGDFGCGSFTLSKRVLSQKSLFVVEVAAEPFSPLKNIFLVTEDFRVELSLKDTVKLKDGSYSSQPLKLKWTELFEEYVVANREKVSASTMMKIAT